MLSRIAICSINNQILIHKLIKKKFLHLLSKFHAYIMDSLDEK